MNNAADAGSESGSGTGAKPGQVTPPRTIDLAALALVLEAIAWVGPYLAVKLGATSYRDYLFKHGSYSTKVDGKSKSFDYNNPSQPGGLAQGHKKVADSVAQTQHAYLLQAFILGAALVLLGYSLRRSRGASPARWSVVVVAVLTQSPLLALNFARNLPAGFGIATGFIGIFAIASLVLLFVPASRQYFRDVRAALAALAPPRPARAARPARTGGLFGPRPSATTTSKPSAKAAPKVAPKQAAGAEAGSGLTKQASAEKKRADAAAVAKGAALARNRAKAAAKSRRMED